MKKAAKVISISLLALISAIFLIIGYCSSAFNLILIGVLLIWGANILFGILYINKNINLFLFGCTFFVLLLGQKTTYMLQGIKWWQNFTDNIYQETLFILYTALSGILLGSVCYYIYIHHLKKKKNKVEELKDNYFNKRQNQIRKVACIAFFITIIIKTILVIEKVIYVQQNSYLALYSGFETIFPSYVKKIADLYFIFLAMYLFTFPKKKNMIKVLIVYMLYLILTIFVGSRGEFVTKLLMIATYLAYRQFNCKEEKYYTKKTIIIIGIIAIILISFLGLYNYIRSDISIEGFNLIKSVKQFFIDQGISADVISYSVVYENQLREREQNYTFGFFVNRYNSIIGRENPTGLKDTALYGNNLGAAISDLVLKERYLNGEGMGTQYIAEVYIDYGYIGVVIYNIILGAVLVGTGNINKQNWLLNTISYLVFSKIIYLPRQFAADWFIIFISSSYILSFILVIVAAEVIYRGVNGKRYKRERENET